MLAVYKKELKSYFTSVIGWVFIAFFLILVGLYFMVYNLMNGYTDFSPVFSGVELFFILLLVPVLTMRIIAEENRPEDGSAAVYVSGIDHKDHSRKISGTDHVVWHRNACCMPVSVDFIRTCKTGGNGYGGC